VRISRTPFRISLGGGSTDLPSYCRDYGGFIFGVAIKMYMDIFVRRPIIYDKIDLQYLQFESVDSLDELQHPIGKEALKMVGIDKSVSVYFKSDTPMGTGLGSSGACAVGLLNALWEYKGITKTQEELAEEAFQITQNLNLPDGRQDPYIAALGGFVILELETDGGVKWYRPRIQPETEEKFIRNSVFFYTGVRRDSEEVLRDQCDDKALKAKHRMKEIGRQIVQSFQSGNLDDFGLLTHEHWILKKETSRKITLPEFDDIYDLAIHNGALGGKIVGAGGGGYFYFYCSNEGEKRRLLSALQGINFREIPLEIDSQGTRAKEVLI